MPTFDPKCKTLPSEGYAVTEYEDRFHHYFNRPKATALDIYKTGEIVLLVKNAEKEIVIKCNESEVEALRARLATAERERDEANRRSMRKDSAFYALITKRDEFKSERDQLRAEVERLTKERDEASQVSPSEREGILCHISSMLSDTEKEEFGLTGRQLHMQVLRVLSAYRAAADDRDALTAEVALLRKKASDTTNY